MAIQTHLFRADQPTEEIESDTQTLIIGGYNTDTQEGRLGYVNLPVTTNPQNWFDNPNNQQEILDALAAGTEDERIARWFRFKDILNIIDNERSWITNTIPLVTNMTAQEIKDTIERILKQNRGILNAVEALGKKIVRDNHI